MARRLAVRLTPVFFIAAVLAASFAATPLGGLTLVSACSTGYLGAPTVTSISPSSGTAGTYVTITGCGFDTAESVQFGTADAFFGAFSDTKIVAVSPSHAVGTVDVTVTNDNGTSATTPADQFTYVASPPAPCANATITPGNSTAPAGTTVFWAASSSECANPRYEFWIRTQNFKWVRKQAYSSNPFFVWDTSGLSPGAYLVVVHVRDASSSAAYQTYAVAHFSTTGCKNATLSQSSSTSHPGTDVTFTATSAGCPDPVYKFIARDPAGHWHVMQNGPSNVFVWHNPGAAKGLWRIVVWANNAGSYMGRPQTYAYKDHRLN
jgi:hypothetical protein